MRKWYNIFNNFVFYSSAVIVPALTGYGIAAMVLILTDSFSTPMLLLVAFPTSVVAVYLMVRLLRRIDRTPLYKQNFSIKEETVVNICAVLLIATWLVVNGMFSFQTALIKRDPGIYSNTGIWLIDHQSTDIPVDKTLTEGVPGASAESSGIWYDTRTKDLSYVQPQGEHFFPMLLATAGKIGGVELLYKTNVIIGAMALFVFYGLVRFFVKPRWALLGVVILMSSLPMIYFSRDTYTEPTAILLGMGAIMSLYIFFTYAKQRSFFDKRGDMGRLFALFPVGLIAGLPPIVRPDGYVVTASILVVLTVVILQSKMGKGQKYVGFLIFLVGASIPAAIGFLDAYMLTSAYFSSHGKDIIQQLVITSLAALVALGLFGFKRKKIHDALEDLHARAGRAYKWLFAGLIAVSVFMVARPFFYKPEAKINAGLGYINNLQRELGDLVESRTYAEHTVSWLEWYIGGIVLILAVAGIGLVLHKVILGRKYIYLLILLPVLVATPIYLMTPRITGDQIWAMRRFLPLVMPLLILFGAIGMGYISDYLNKKVDKQIKPYVKLGIIGIIGVMVMQPLVTSRPFIKTVEAQGQLATIRSLCDSVPTNSLIIWGDYSVLAREGVQSTRGICGFASVGLNDGVKKDGTLKYGALATIEDRAEEKGLVAYLAISGSAKQYFKDKGDTDPFKVIGVYGGAYVERTLMGPPDNVLYSYDSVELARIADDGTLQPIRSKK